MSAEHAAIAAEAISKRFGGVQALENVSFSVRPGEVHGLIGANGAGKSTLIGVLSGATLPDSGALQVGGYPVAFGDVGGARRAGIAVVHQELMLFPDRTVEENVAASALPLGLFGLRDLARQRRSVRETLGRLSAGIDLRTRVADLPLAQQQMVEIARALHGGGSVFILDEPTSALSQPEVTALFAALRGLVRDGAAVVFVSHRLDEVLAITDAITVLRDGRVAGRMRTSEADVAGITRAMVGDLASSRIARAERPAAAAVLSLRGVRAAGLGPIELDLHPGEVVGLIGLEGSGIGTLLRIMGGDIGASGEIRVDGRPLRPRHPADALAAGIVYMPPDRKQGGLWLDRPANWNIATAAIGRMSALRWLSQQSFERTATARLAEVGVRQGARNAPVARLSGGNQQRVLFARSLDMAPRVLLLSDFTRGVDVRAKADIQRLVRTLAERKGVAVCLSSSDVQEVLDVSDRVVCLRGGQVVAAGRAADFDQFRALAVVSTAASDRQAGYGPAKSSGGA
jgi:ABC-type sugar transport system ATPase subunit